LVKFYTFMEEEGELVEQEATRVEERLRTSKLVLRMYSTEGGSVTITSVSPPKGNTKWKVPLGDCTEVSLVKPCAAQHKLYLAGLFEHVVLEAVLVAESVDEVAQDGQLVRTRYVQLPLHTTTPSVLKQIK
jgi:hypothetical protein